MVVAGVTLRVPPVAANVLLLPSEPVTVTAVALVAATVKVDAAPAATEVGFALIVTVGDVGVVVPAPTVPHPVITRSNDKVIARGMRIVRSGRETRSFITMLWSFLLCSGERSRLKMRIAKTTVDTKRENRDGGAALYRVIHLSFVEATCCASFIS